MHIMITNYSALNRQGFDGHILRFAARLLIDGKVDTLRKFVIAYFLSDDTILVSLERELNSGNSILNYTK